LRRILPQGTAILVCYWSDEGDAPAAKELLEAAEADAYATSLSQAVELCIAAAKGELTKEEAAKEPIHAPGITPFPVRDTKRRKPNAKTHSAPVS
jgi:hypothetical protein